MRQWFAISILAIAQALSGLPFASMVGSQQSKSKPQHQPQPPSQSQPPSQQPPSDTELNQRADKLIANQHQNDYSLDQYERIERQVSQTAGMSPRILEDRTFRIVPNGTGTMKILLSERGKAVDPNDYRKQLQLWEQTLEIALKPGDSRAKAAYAKYEKKKKDRSDLIDGTKEGFVHRWVGRESVNGHLCDILQLEPNPEFRPHTLLQEAMSHVTAKIWVDHDQNQLVRGEAHVIKDLSFGGGILGKLYRGGVFSLEQAEVAPGVWLPTRYQYDFTARKFLFTFEEHQFIEAFRYKRVGSAKEALAVVQSELASGKSFAADP
jgi:hypothetical protein